MTRNAQVLTANCDPETMTVRYRNERQITKDTWHIWGRVISDKKAIPLNKNSMMETIIQHRCVGTEIFYESQPLEYSVLLHNTTILLPIINKSKL